MYCISLNFYKLMKLATVVLTLLIPIICASDSRFPIFSPRPFGLLLFLSKEIIAFSESLIRRKYWKTPICWDESKIHQVYKHMIDAGRREVYGSVNTALKDYFSFFQINTVDNDDLGFYKVYFGIAKLSLPENLENLKSITYHRIFKNGNDNIRYLLYRFVSSLYANTNTTVTAIQESCNNMSNSTHKGLDGGVSVNGKGSCLLYAHRMTSDTSDVHIVDSLFHSQLHHHSIFYECPMEKYEKSLLFTFVRDPIARFISAVTEIEYRAIRKNKSIDVVTAELGSQRRLEQFIDVLLDNKGSGRLYLKPYEQLQLQHLAPQLGTLLYFSHCWGHHHQQSRTSDRGEVDRSILIDGNIDSKYDFSVQRTKIFKLERFDTEWSRLASMTPYKELFEDSYARFKSDFRAHHRSSQDIYNTTRAGKSLMSYAGLEGYESPWGSKLNGQDIFGIPWGRSLQLHKRIARNYLRALCRLYVLDFLCMGYTLPKECHSLYDEVDALSSLQSQSKIPGAKKLVNQKVTESRRREIYYYRVFVTLLLTVCFLLVCFAFLFIAISTFIKYYRSL